MSLKGLAATAGMAALCAVCAASCIKEAEVIPPQARQHLEDQYRLRVTPSLEAELGALKEALARDPDDEKITLRDAVVEVLADRGPCAADRRWFRRVEGDFDRAYRNAVGKTKGLADTALVEALADHLSAYVNGPDLVNTAGVAAVITNMVERAMDGAEGKLKDTHHAILERRKKGVEALGPKGIPHDEYCTCSCVVMTKPQLFYEKYMLDVVASHEARLPLVRKGYTGEREQAMECLRRLRDEACYAGGAFTCQFEERYLKIVQDQVQGEILAAIRDSSELEEARKTLLFVYLDRTRDSYMKKRHYDYAALARIVKADAGRSEVLANVIFNNVDCPLEAARHLIPLGGLVAEPKNVGRWFDLMETCARNGGTVEDDVVEALKACEDSTDPIKSARARALLKKLEALKAKKAGEISK